VSGALNAVESYLRQQDRSGLNQYLVGLTGSVLSVIEVEEPLDGRSVARPQIDVRGTTIPHAQIVLSCNGRSYGAQSSSSDGRFSFTGVALISGVNDVELRLTSTLLSDRGPRTRWQTRQEPDPNVRQVVRTLTSCSLSIELRAPFAGQRNPVTAEPFMPEDFDRVVRCPVCRVYSYRQDWDDQCPLVEAGQCTHHSSSFLTWEDEGFDDQRTAQGPVRLEVTCDG
jgi:hypothetical protein